ncbi:permease-like cell division protein FtsX [Hutsoniella sourekii]|uniref:permease-like cell division protein FtsX n=1 Tax=Hutsoniella sourekii TaxID=87650 RepID=UPI000483053C|nr:permease-like cell division protein FtsX [Hutsoniella sourekii]
MRVFRSWGRHLRDGFRNLFRNGWMTTATIITMTMTLFVIGGLAVLISNVNTLTNNIEDGMQIRTHIDIAASQEDAEKLKHSIEAIDHVQKVSFRSKEEELEALISNVGSEFELFQGDANPLYDVYLVDVDNPDYLGEVADQIRQLPYAVEVGYGELDTSKLLESIDTVRLVLALVASILVIIAVILVTNTIRMTINSRQKEIEIMRLVGARKSYIRAPFTIEGFFIGIVSGLIASLFLYGAYEGLQQAILETIGNQVIHLTPLWPFILYVSAGLLITGALLGMIGSYRSTSRFLKI